MLAYQRCDWPSEHQRSETQRLARLAYLFTVGVRRLLLERCKRLVMFVVELIFKWSALLICDS